MSEIREFHREQFPMPIKVGIGSCQYCGHPRKTNYKHDSELGRIVGAACLPCLVQRMAIEHDNDPRVKGGAR